MSRVRPFEEKDAQALAAIYRECRTEAAWHSRVATDSDFARDTKGELLLVAVDGDDEPEGFVSAWEPDAFIHHLYVRTGSQRNGVGTQLLEALRARLPGPWRLKCVRANDRALAFYLREGWREISSGVGEDGPYAVLEKANVVGGVALRRLGTSDLTAFQAYRCDPELGRYQGWSTMSDAEAREFLGEMSSVPLFRPGKWLQLGIASPKDLSLLGDIGLYLAGDSRHAEIGFTLARSAQGHGFATAAAQEAIRMVFRLTPVERVLGITDARNHASVGVLERVGMRKESERAALFRGEMCVEYVYAMGR